MMPTGDIARTARDRAAGMTGGARVVKIGDRRAVAEVVAHHLLDIERAHENIAGPHVNEFARVIARGVDVSRDACGCRLFSD
jgi:hypothetical protein